MNFITPEFKQACLMHARKKIAERLKIPYKNVVPPEKSLKEKSGAFVTLHVGRNLRGCIGRITPEFVIWDAIGKMALESAFHDPRFASLKKEEFQDIDIEISLISPFTILASIDTIVIGKHGLYLKSHTHSGLLLPQVAKEQHWNVEQYLEHICMKAGLPTGSWNNPGVELYTFTAVVFGEKSHI